MFDPPSTPETIERLTDGAMAAFAALAGMQLDVFSPLKEGPKTAQQIAEDIGADSNKLSLLLYALVVAELLTVKDGLFANTQEADTFLVQGLQTYVGGRHVGLLKRWQDAFSTADSIRKGKAEAKLNFSEMPEVEFEEFLLGLHPQAKYAGLTLTERFDLSSHRRMLEVGAGLGGVAQVVVNAQPQITAVLVDFPAVTAVAKKSLAEAGLADRISVEPANAITDSLGGPFDLAVMKSLIQVLSPDEAQQMLTNVSRSLEPGGSLYVIGRIIEDSRIQPASAVLYNVTFLNVYDGGQAYTESEYRNWLTSAGFGNIEIVTVPGSDSILRAQKS